MIKKCALIALASVALAGCQQIESGHVGVKVNNYGSSAGVQEKALGVGRYWTLGTGSTIYEYPVYTINYVYGNSEEANNEIPFQDKNGLALQADVNVAYRVNPKLAPQLFQIYRGDMDAIIAGPLRNRVRSAINNAASTMTVEQIYGPGKAQLIQRALKEVRAYFEPQGLHVDQMDWAGPIRIPESITERIKARAQTEQAAIAAQAEVATNRAKGAALIAKKEAEAKARVAEAQGFADAQRIRSQAIEQNPIIQDEWTRKWDGKLPQVVYCSSENPCVNTGR